MEKKRRPLLFEIYEPSKQEGNECCICVEKDPNRLHWISSTLHLPCVLEIFKRNPCEPKHPFTNLPFSETELFQIKFAALQNKVEFFSFYEKYRSQIAILNQKIKEWENLLEFFQARHLLPFIEQTKTEYSEEIFQASKKSSPNKNVQIKDRLQSLEEILFIHLIWFLHGNHVFL
jgi:hypothetical protein